MAVAVLALAGAGLVLLSTARYGAGLSPDSVDYLDVARSLVSGKGFVLHTGEPLVWYPPLYPMLLALIGFATRLDPTAFAHLVNAVLFALVICLSARLLQPDSRQTPTYRVLGLCAVLLSVPLSQVYGWAWSECLFIPLVLLYLVFAQRYWDSGGVLALAVMTLSTALACLTRYIGVALVPAGVLTIILASGVNTKTRFTRAFIFAALSLAPLGLWMVRNYRLTQTLFGGRGPLQKTLADNVIAGAKAVLSWYAFGLVSKLVGLAGIAVLIVIVLSARSATRRVKSSLKTILIGHSPAVILLATYFVVLLVAATRDAVIDYRMLSPLYVPATLILLKLGSYLLSPTQDIPNAVAGKVPAVLLALWLCFPLQNVASATAGRFKNGAGGYNTETCRESKTVAYVKQMLSTNDDVPVYSNDPLGLWALARIDANFSPSKTAFSQYRLTARSLGDLIGRWPPEGEACLVWFNVDIAWLFSVEELKEVANAVEVAHFADGTVYRVSIRGAEVRDSSTRGETILPSQCPLRTCPMKADRPLATQGETGATRYCRADARSFLLATDSL